MEKGKIVTNLYQLFRRKDNVVAISLQNGKTGDVTKRQGLQASLNFPLHFLKCKFLVLFHWRDIKENMKAVSSG